MRRNFILINIVLACLLIFFSFRLYSIWSSPLEEIRPSQKKTQTEKGEAEEVRKDIASYQVIVQKDLFRPSRTEFKPVAKSTLPPTPPPRIFGILIMDNNKIAILEDSTSKKKKNYHVGESIGDLVVSEIEKDKVILLRGDEKVIVNLREVKTINAPSRPGAAKPRPAPKSVTPPAQRPPVPPMPGQQPQPAPPTPPMEEFPETFPPLTE